LSKEIGNLLDGRSNSLQQDFLDVRNLVKNTTEKPVLCARKSLWFNYEECTMKNLRRNSTAIITGNSSVIIKPLK
jgi:hypothetical protein